MIVFFADQPARRAGRELPPLSAVAVMMKRMQAAGISPWYMHVRHARLPGATTIVVNLAYAWQRAEQRVLGHRRYNFRRPAMHRGALV